MPSDLWCATFACLLGAVSVFPLIGSCSWAEERHHLGGAVRVRYANQAGKRGVGSASVLKGKIVLGQIFLDDERSSWDAATIEQTQRDVDLALEFIHRQAALHGQKVELQRAPANRARYRGSIPLDPHAPPSWTEAAIRQAQEHSSQEEIDRLRELYGAEQVAILLHAHQKGLSYNLAYYPGVRPEFAAERAVCFRFYPDGRRTAPATYGHEILHLFGAGDLYFPFDQDHARKNSAAQWFPDDIMFRVDYHLERLLIGGFTAYRIGWRPVLESQWAALED